MLYAGTEGRNGGELWVSDGTTAGSDPGFMAVLGRVAVFTADDGVNGLELWRSASGPADSYPEFLTLSGGRLLFRAKDPLNGQEPRVLFPGATSQTRGETWPWASSAALEATDPVLGSLFQVRGRTAYLNQPYFLLAGSSAAPSRFPCGAPLYLDPSRPMSVLHAGTAPVHAWGWQIILPSDPALIGLGLGLQAFQITPASSFAASKGVVATFGL